MYVQVVRALVGHVKTDSDVEVVLDCVEQVHEQEFVSDAVVQWR